MASCTRACSSAFGLAPASGARWGRRAVSGTGRAGGGRRAPASRPLRSRPCAASRGCRHSQPPTSAGCARKAACPRAGCALAVAGCRWRGRRPPSGRPLRCATP
eukprot:scaffold194192_cov28-Tisochrysis_lutea.AAC.2